MSAAQAASKKPMDVAILDLPCAILSKKSPQLTRYHICQGFAQAFIDISVHVKPLQGGTGLAIVVEGRGEYLGGHLKHVHVGQDYGSIITAQL